MAMHVWHMCRHCTMMPAISGNGKEEKTLLCHVATAAAITAAVSALMNALISALISAQRRVMVSALIGVLISALIGVLISALISSVISALISAVVSAVSSSVSSTGKCHAVLCCAVLQWRLKGSREPQATALRSLLTGQGVPAKVRHHDKIPPRHYSFIPALTMAEHRLCLGWRCCSGLVRHWS